MKQRLIRYFAIPFVATTVILGGLLVAAHIIGPHPDYLGRMTAPTPGAAFYNRD